MTENVTVVRGPDWCFDDQDGGEGGTGTVIKVLRSSLKIGSRLHPPKTAFVKWSDGSINLYRVGSGDAYDLRILDNSDAGVKHEGVKCDSCDDWNFKGIRWKCTQCDDYDLCTKCYMSDKHNLTHEFFRIETPNSDKVRVSKRQGAHKITRKTRKISGLSASSLLEVLVKVALDLDDSSSSYYRDHLPVLALPKFAVDDVVLIEKDSSIVKSKQEGHGGWNDNMAKASGKLGKVILVFPDGDLKVAVDDDIWTYNPSCLTKVDEKEIGIMALGAALSGALEAAGGEGLGGLIGNFVKNILEKDETEEADVKTKKSGKEDDSNELDKLVDLMKDGIDKQDNDGDTPLHVAMDNDNTEFAEILLKKGADVNVVNKKGQSPLHLAVCSQSDEGIKLLLKHKCNVIVQDKDGNSALHYALQLGGKGPVDLLISHPGIDILLKNEKGHNVLHHAVVHGNEYGVEKIIEKSLDIVNSSTNDGNSALHLAIKSGYFNITKLLLEKGECQTEIRNKMGETPLVVACRMGRCSDVELLVFLNADVNAEDKNGNTGLHLSLLNQRNEDDVILTDAPALSRILSGIKKIPGVEKSHGLAIACFLAQKGANIFHKNHIGKTALDLALSSTVRDLLVKFAGITVNDESKEAPSEGATVTEPEQHASECMICYESDELVVFKPCGHQLVCLECSLRVKKCIICRKEIVKETGAERGAENVYSNANQASGSNQTYSDLKRQELLANITSKWS